MSSFILAKTILAGSDSPVTRLEVDEELMFYPSYAFQTVKADDWTIRIHGRVYEPERDSTVRRGLISLLKEALGMELGSLESLYFDERAGYSWRMVRVVGQSM